MKKTGKKLVRVLSILLCAALVLCALPMSALAQEGDTAALSYYYGYNINMQDYTRCAYPIYSYLTPTADGGMMRFQADAPEEAYLVEYYDSAYNVSKTLEVPQELNRFGGFYASDSNYYILTGQTNFEESPEVECFRITKYDLNWNRLSSAGLYDCNTTIPFDAASARFAMDGKYLLVRTGHEMYTSDDGLNHQANVTIELDTETMTITDSATQVAFSRFGYASHSFNQFIQFEENGQFAAVDHGDAYPRSIVLLHYEEDASSGRYYAVETDLLTFPGEIGDNYTGASVGGFEISDTSYLVAYNTVAQDENYFSNFTRNIEVAVMDKVTGEVTNKQITFTDEEAGYNCTPHLVKVADDKFMLLWSFYEAVEGAYGYVDYWLDGVYYAMLDDDGDIIGEIGKIDDAALSDCVPVVSGDKLVWYVWLNSITYFFEIDLVDISKHNTVVIASLPGDLSNSGVVDVADIMYIKELIMTGAWGAEELALGDLSGNGSLDVADIMQIKNIIMKF